MDGRLSDKQVAHTIKAFAVHLGLVWFPDFSGGSWRYVVTSATRRFSRITPVQACFSREN